MTTQNLGSSKKDMKSKPDGRIYKHPILQMYTKLLRPGERGKNKTRNLWVIGTQKINNYNIGGGSEYMINALG